jgi:hypothetical protein
MRAIFIIAGVLLLAAVGGFLYMKTRYNVVAGELIGAKTADMKELLAPKGNPVVSVVARSGAAVDSLGFKLKDGTVIAHGGMGGGPSEIAGPFNGAGAVVSKNGLEGIFIGFSEGASVKSGGQLGNMTPAVGMTRVVYTAPEGNLIVGARVYLDAQKWVRGVQFLSA